MDDGELLLVAGYTDIGWLDVSDGAATVQALPLAEGTYGGGEEFVIDALVVNDQPVGVLADGTAVWFDPADGSQLRSLSLGALRGQRCRTRSAPRRGGVGDEVRHHARLARRRRADQFVDPAAGRPGAARR